MWHFNNNDKKYISSFCCGRLIPFTNLGSLFSLRFSFLAVLYKYSQIASIISDWMAWWWMEEDGEYRDEVDKKSKKSKQIHLVKTQ